MPVDAIDDAAVLTETVGQIVGIEDLGNDSFAVRIALSSGAGRLFDARTA
jgi:hypothetical protein